MADFEKVYSIDYDVSKALNSLRKLEKMLINIDTKSRELFHSSDTIKRLERLTAAVKKTGATSVASAEKTERAKIAAAERAERQKVVAAQRAERQRTRDAERAERQRERTAQQALRRKIMWAERASRERVREERAAARESARLERQRLQAAQRATRERVREERAAARDSARLERQRLQAARRAERAKVAATRRAERQRERAAERASRSIMRMASRVAVLVGAAAGIRDVVSGFVDFDQAATSAAAKFSRLEPQLRPGTEGFKEFSREIRQAGIGTEHSAAAVARAVDFWAKAGKTSTESKAVLQSTLDFASANQDASGNMLDVARAGDILSDTLGAFRLPAKDANELMASTARVADVMSAAANRANMSSEELFEAFVNAGPALTSIGSDIEETSALLAAMANAGIKGSQAGNQLKMVVSNLAALTGPQEAALRELGVTVKDQEGNFKGLTTVIRELNVATADMGSGDRYQVFAKAAGRRAVPAFINLLAEGKTNLDSMADSLRGAGGEVGNLAEQMRQSTQAQMGMFANRLRDIGYRILDTTDFFGLLNRGINAIDFDWLVEKGGQANTAMGEFFRSIPDLATRAGQSIRSEFSDVFGMLDRVILNAEESFNGFARGVSREWDSTFGHITALGDTLAEAYGSVFDEIKALFTELVSAFLDGTDDIEEDWYGTGDRMASDIAETVRVISTIIGTIATTASAVFSTVLRIVTSVVQNVRSVFGNLFDGVIDIAEGRFLDGITRVGVALADAITLPFRAAIAGLLKLISKIPGASDLAESFGINLDEIGAAVSEGFGGLVAPAEREINRAGAIDERQARQDVAPYIDTFGGYSVPPAFEPPPEMQSTPFNQPQPVAQSYAPDEWEAQVTSFVDGVQSALDVSAAQAEQGGQSLDRLVELSTTADRRQEQRAAEARAFEQRMTAAAQSEVKSVTQNVTVGPTSIKVEAKGVTLADAERAARRALSDAGREIKRGVRDGLRSEGPAEI